MIVLNHCVCYLVLSIRMYKYQKHISNKIISKDLKNMYTWSFRPMGLLYLCFSFVCLFSICCMFVYFCTFIFHVKEDNFVLFTNRSSPSVPVKKYHGGRYRHLPWFCQERPLRGRGSLLSEQKSHQVLLAYNVSAHRGGARERITHISQRSVSTQTV